MNYDKTTWTTGDIITAEKLNNIESGVENASIIDVVATDGNLNMTYKEMLTVVHQGKTVRFINDYDDEYSSGTDVGFIVGLNVSGGIYTVTFNDGTSASSESEDGTLIVS